MTNTSYIVLAIFCCLSVSCIKYGNRENNHLIEQALELIEHQPDSALKLIDAVNTIKLSKAERMEYILLRVQARSNVGMDISTDVEIFDVREYYIRKKDAEKVALACFYAALLAAGTNNIEKAMEYFLEALEYVKKTNLKQLQGRILYNIGSLNYNNSWYEYALLNYKQALTVFQSLDLYQREIHSLNSIANTMIVKGEVDSAQYYYQLALNRAYLFKDTAMLEMVYNNMTVAYIELEEHNIAIDYIRQALRLATSNNIKALIYLNFAEIYNVQNNIDSARFYKESAETLLNNIDDDFTSVYLAYLSFQIEKNAGDFLKAIEYLEIYYKLNLDFLEDNDRKLMLEMQKRYDIKVQEKEHHKKINMMWRIVAGLLFGLLMFAVCSIYMLRKNLKQKAVLTKTQLEKTKIQLAKEIAERERAEIQLIAERAEREKIEKAIELENAIQQAQTLHEMHDRLHNQLKNRYLNKIEIIKKFASLLPYFKNDIISFKNMAEEINFINKTNGIVKDIDVKNFVDVANELYPNFTDKLKQKCDTLDDREIIICCLLLLDFSNSELDLFLHNRMKDRLNTIRSWKRIIRRKMGIDQNGDFKEHFLKNIMGI